MTCSPALNLAYSGIPVLGNFFVTLGPVLVHHFPSRQHQTEGDVGIFGQSIWVPSADRVYGTLAQASGCAAKQRYEPHVHTSLLVDLITSRSFQVQQPGQAIPANVPGDHPAHDRPNSGIEER